MKYGNYGETCPESLREPMDRTTPLEFRSVTRPYKVAETITARAEKIGLSAREPVSWLRGNDVIGLFAPDGTPVAVISITPADHSVLEPVSFGSKRLCYESRMLIAFITPDHEGTDWRSKLMDIMPGHIAGN